jgi:hypothetical protein
MVGPPHFGHAKMRFFLSASCDRRRRTLDFELRFAGTPPMCHYSINLSETKQVQKDLSRIMSTPKHAEELP